MRLATIIPYIFGLSLVITGGCGRVGTLMELGANEGLKRQTVREETKNYEAVKTALAKNAIKQGMTKNQIVRRYGQPVLAYRERDGSQRLVYKATASDWLKGENIYLFFDNQDIFTSASCVECP